MLYFDIDTYKLKSDSLFKNEMISEVFLKNTSHTLSMYLESIKSSNAPFENECHLGNIKGTYTTLFDIGLISSKSFHNFGGIIRKLRALLIE